MSGLPEGWVRTTLGNTTRHKSGNGKLIKGKQHAEAAEGLFPAFSASGQDVWVETPEHSGDAVVISAVGARCGKAFLASGQWSAVANTHIVWPEPEVIDARWLWLRLNDENFWIKGGSAQPFVKVGATFELALDLPPLVEQRRIVANLDALTARTARARADLDRIPVLAARYKQAVLAQAFSGELTAEWRGDPEFSPGSATLPRTWRWEELQALASDEARSIQSGPFGSNLRHSEFRPEGRLVVGIDNVQDGRFSIGANHRISQKKFEELEKYRARPGDVAITVMATVGRTCVIPDDIEPAIITKHIYRITLDREVADPHFVMNALRGAEPVLAQMGANVRGQTRPGINGSILKALQMPLAPLEEQREIVRRINRAFAEIDQLVAEASAARRLLERLDQAVLAKAFRGELVPQDPADEPASALLDRIRAERASAPKATRVRRKAAA